MLKENGKYTEALKILGSLEMLPAEGDVNAHSLFRETNMLCALGDMKRGNWKKAVLYLQKAETWPVNLFSGEPYLADNRVTQFLSAYCFMKLKAMEPADKAFAYITGYRNPDGWTSNAGNRLTALTGKGSRDFREITGTLLNEKVKDRDDEILALFLKML